jgi:hypothetical protein
VKRKFAWITWSNLRSFGNSRAVQLSAMFPFIGYWILFNDYLSQYFKLGALDAPASAWLDVLWNTKLYFLYFGLLSLGLGSFIYQARCPHIVKKHGDWTDYVRTDGTAMNADQLLILATIAGVAARPVAENRSMIMQSYYAQSSNTKAFSRLLVGIFFLLGMLLLAVPSLLSAWKIGKLFSSHLG